MEVSTPAACRTRQSVRHSDRATAYTIKSKFNNTANTVQLLAIRFLTAFSQPTHTIVSYSLLIHGPLVSFTKFFGSCAQTGCKLTTRFSSLSSLLSSTSASSQLTAHYNTCSKAVSNRRLIWKPELKWVSNTILIASNRVPIQKTYFRYQEEHNPNLGILSSRDLFTESVVF